MPEKETLGQKLIRERYERLERRRKSARAKPQGPPKKESGKDSLGKS